MIYDSIFEYLGRTLDAKKLVKQWIRAFNNYFREEKYSLIFTKYAEFVFFCSYEEAMENLNYCLLELFPGKTKKDYYYYNSLGFLLALLMRKRLINWPKDALSAMIKKIRSDKDLEVFFADAAKDTEDSQRWLEQFCVCLMAFIDSNLFPLKEIKKMTSSLRAMLGLLEEVPTRYSSGGDESPRTERRMAALHSIIAKRMIEAESGSSIHIAGDIPLKKGKRQRVGDVPNPPTKKTKSSKSLTKPKQSSTTTTVTTPPDGNALPSNDMFAVLSSEALSTRGYEPMISKMMPPGSAASAALPCDDTRTQDLPLDHIRTITSFEQVPVMRATTERNVVDDEDESRSVRLEDDIGMRERREEDAMIRRAKEEEGCDMSENEFQTRLYDFCFGDNNDCEHEPMMMYSDTGNALDDDCWSWSDDGRHGVIESSLMQSSSSNGL